MKVIKAIAVFVLFSLMLVAANQAEAIYVEPSYDFNGMLSSADGGILGTGAWVNSPQAPFAIEWWVTQMEDSSWEYKYNIRTPVGAVSHAIIEVSPSFTLANLIEGDYDELGTYSPSDPGSSNPGLPGSIYGIKFAGDSTNQFITFYSDRAPVWGDFYSKDGAAGGLGQNAAWNAGFLNLDPEDAPSDGSIGYKILRPDTTTTVVPEASTLALAVMGAVPILLIRRKSK